MLRGIGAIGREQGKMNLCGEKSRTYGLEPLYVAAALERLRSSARDLEPVFSSAEPLRLGVAFCDQTICADCPYGNVCSSATGLRTGRAVGSVAMRKNSRSHVLRGSDPKDAQISG